MSILTFLTDADTNSLGGVATLGSQTAGRMVYDSLSGHRVVLTGTGLTYDLDGILTGGTISRITVSLGGTPEITWTGLACDATDYSRLALGQISGSPDVSIDTFALEIELLSGNDAIFGGPGSRDLFGSFGNDVLRGGGGNDGLNGGSGRDSFYGGTGSDRLDLFQADGAGHGVIVDLRLTTRQIRDDGYGNVETARGIERWDGSQFNDVIIGSAGIDSLFGGDGNDVLRGGAGSDFILGGAGNDRLFGSTGDDQMFNSSGADIIDGGEGYDSLSWNEGLGTTFGVVVDLRLATNNILDDGFSNTETATGIESFSGTSLGDEFWARDVAATSPDQIKGLDGNDTLHGGAAASALAGGEGLDVIEGGSGDETIGGGAGQDSCEGGLGVDTLDFNFGATPENGVVADMRGATLISDDGYGNIEFAAGFERFELTNFGDSFTGSESDDNIHGSSGNDVIAGANGADTLRGGEDDDTLSGGGGEDLLEGNAGTDNLTGGGGADEFIFNQPLSDLTVDVITDMVAGVDHIQIDTFWGGGVTGDGLTAVQFGIGAGMVAATTADQRVFYNSTTGDLYFDADGSDTVFAALHFATLSNLANISFADISSTF